MGYVVGPREAIINYCTEEFPFVRLIKDLFPEVEQLEKVHAIPHDKHEPMFFNDSDTIFHRRYYDRIDQGWPEFLELYEKFVNIVARKYFNQPFCFQKVPNIRISLPLSKAIGAWHTDSDTLHQHPSGEINFLLPLTEMYDTNSLYLESEPGRNDFRPVKLKPGQLFKFDGANCLHGNLVNQTGQTRISFDFRIILPQDISETVLTSRRGVQFKPQAYYSFSKL